MTGYWYFRYIPQKFGIAYATAHGCVELVTGVLYSTCGQFIKFLHTDDSYKETARDFGRYSFPNVISAIDGTHIRIKPPADHKAEYCSRKHQFAINLTAIADGQLRLTSVFSGYSAKCHDSKVFKASRLYEKIRHKEIPQQISSVRRRSIRYASEYNYPIQGHRKRVDCCTNHFQQQIQSDNDGH